MQFLEWQYGHFIGTPVTKSEFYNHSLFRTTNIFSAMPASLDGAREKPVAKEISS
jgi:hypothetical protein